MPPHHVRDEVAAKTIKREKVITKEMIANILTKLLHSTDVRKENTRANGCNILKILKVDETGDGT